MKTFFVLALLVGTQAFAALPGGDTLFQAKCAACHGATGVNPNPMYPNLAGQKVGYLFQQLKDFRDGKRQGTVMPNMANGLTDEQIAALAGYISSLSPCHADF